MENNVSFSGCFPGANLCLISPLAFPALRWNFLPNPLQVSHFFVRTGDGRFSGEMLLNAMLTADGKRHLAILVTFLW